MKRLITAALFTVLLLGSYQSRAIVAGAYTIPTFPKWPTLAAMIDTLNLYGISGTGGVTITMGTLLSMPETAPNGGFMLGSATLSTSMTTAGRFITILGKGRTLTANVGSGSNDAIFTIQGTDNVTIDSFVLNESSSNTTATTMMERGFSIVKLDATDGCKTVSLTKNIITLNNTNTTAASGVAGNGSMGIFIGNCNATSSAALGAPTAIEGSHDGFFFSKNTIQNVNHGVYGNGTGIAVDGIAFNDGNVTIENNTIQNFINRGIYLVFFNNDFVSNNLINNMSGGGSAAANSIYGIFYNGATIATNNNWTCDGNNINLTLAGTSIGAWGIYSQIVGTGTTVIQNDTVKLTCTGTTGQLIGIYGQNVNGTTTITKNVVTDFSNTSTTNTFNIAGIWNGKNGGTPTGYPTVSTITNNVIRNFNISSAANVFACIDQNIVNTNPSVFRGNIVSDIRVLGNMASLKGYQFRGIGTTLPLTLTCTDNIFRNISAVGTTTPITVIDPAASTTIVSNLSRNRLQNISAGTGFLTGVQLDFGKTMTFVSDTIINLSGSGDVVAYKAGFAGPAVVTQVFDKNMIDSLSSDGTNAIVSGFNITTGTSNFTTTNTITTSLIRRITASGTNATASAIRTAGSTTTYGFLNNMISDISAANNTTAYSSSFGMLMGNTGANNINFNTIKMNSAATAVSGYGATALQYNPSGTNVIQNNILHVNAIAGAANNVSAIRAASGAAKAAPSVAGFTASSNIYFTPTDSNNYLYVEGTTNTTLVNGYHVSGLTPNNTRNIVNDTFFNSECNKSSYHQFMQTATASREKNTFTENNLAGASGVFSPAGLSYAEGTATDGTISIDFALAARPFGSSDIGALEFGGGTRPQMTITITSSTGFDTACTFNLPSLTASIPAFFNRVSYQWYRDTTKLIGKTTKTTFVTAISGNYIIQVYDSVTGCTYASDPYRMTIVPPPPAIITYYDSLTFCESSAIVIQANKGPNYIYRWIRNGSFLSGETNDHLVVSTAGDYNLEVNTPLGCATVSSPIRVKVYPLPTPTITWAGRELTTQKYYTYQWYKNNVKIDSFSKARNYYCFDDGAYSVEVTDSNGCTAKSDVYLYSLGIANNPITASIKLYPNPVSNVLTIESPIAIDARISDLTGRTLLNVSNAKTIDCSTLANGMYIISLSNKEGNIIAVEKINKQR